MSKSPYTKTPATELKEYQATTQGTPTIAFTLHFHLADGTTQDVPCVGTFTKEQDDDDSSR